MKIEQNEKNYHEKNRMVTKTFAEPLVARRFLADNFSNDSESFHSVFFSANYSDHVTFRTDQVISERLSVTILHSIKKL